MQTDTLIIGSGIAGLNFALNAAKFGKVTIITKKKAAESSTNKAQGGIAAVMSKADNFEEHVKDTLTAGCFHNNEKSVRYMVKHGPEAIKQLVEYGVNFTKKNGEIALTKEGGHGQRRIAFVGDYTGQEIEKTLLKNVKNHPEITLIENCCALALLLKKNNCHGAQVIKENKIFNIFASQTILATGGIGQLYKYTTNPRIATGDGIALAYQAGCKVKDMEFIQFHPTAFAHPLNPKFLLSEALRGEGAILLNHKHKRFMQNYHPLKELAPRDIVSRAIFKEQKAGTVFLDMRHEKEDFLKTRFPQIFTKLLKHGYNMAHDLIPITPVAHYLCGGITVGLHGETGVNNLYAFGEVAYTGVHGANRLASNSLLEALVFSNNVLKNIKPQNKAKVETFKLPKINPDTNTAKQIKRQIKEIMWRNVGIVREKQQLQSAVAQLNKLEKRVAELEKNGSNQYISEAKNMIIVGKLISQAALKNTSSLGCHFILPSAQPA